MRKGWGRDEIDGDAIHVARKGPRKRIVVEVVASHLMRFLEEELGKDPLVARERPLRDVRVDAWRVESLRQGSEPRAERGHLEGQRRQLLGVEVVQHSRLLPLVYGLLEEEGWTAHRIETVVCRLQGLDRSRLAGANGANNLKLRARLANGKRSRRGETAGPMRGGVRVRRLLLRTSTLAMRQWL